MADKLFPNTDIFVNRHNGPKTHDVDEMLKVIGVNSIDELIDETVPQDIRMTEKLNLPDALGETEMLKDLKELALMNKVFRSYIGTGYFGTFTPSVILRNIMENPGWYTAYTPYQAEIAQGRLEALLNYQTMIIDLTGLPVANASLLDEGSAAAEAMHVLFAARKPGKKNANKFFVSEECFPQTIDVLKTRSVPLGIELVIVDHKSVELTDDMFGLIVQYPADNGEICEYRNLFEQAKSKNIFTVCAADILSLALLTPPADFGADIAVGSTQRFGIPMGFGGPHAAYFACKDEFRRLIPGRIIGVSVDSQGNKAFRMALQTREQHIRREKATSNICTAQVLLAVMAGMYAVYHGPKGIKAIAERVHKMTSYLAASLKELGIEKENKYFFDTITLKTGKELTANIKSKAEAKEINFRYVNDETVGISIDETVCDSDLNDIIKIFSEATGKKAAKVSLNGKEKFYPDALSRASDYMLHPVFNTHHSETEMLRYMKQLENKDLSLNTSMIALGSCTMKLNATTEMIPVTWQSFSSIHPFVPKEQVKGYYELFARLEKDLCEITGFDSVSLQPNSGAQGEYAGLMVVKAFHSNRGESHRNVALIPASAHGTNPASAVMAGMKVVVVKSTDKGEIDVEDLKVKAEQNKSNLAALMVTYPSTHGVFEDTIIAISRIVHKNGGLVYMDGANLNAQIGLTNPALIGADVCHLNLHKTFCIPHGGGGPGMGPIAVTKTLAPFLPGHPVVKIGNEKSITAVSAAPWGSASILIISYAYIRMMGGEGLTDATKIAILNANYIKVKLEKYYPVLYTGENGRNAHELIFDMREFKKTAGVEVEDIAKRLMDYGFHAPTVSFPVPGTFMVEPTESEPKQELDRFCDAMISIRREIDEIVNNEADRADNVLKNAPHTAFEIASESWKHKYSREKAAYPAEHIKANKFWPSVGRVDNAYGDRNFVCSCEPISSYEEVGSDR